SFLMSDQESDPNQRNLRDIGDQSQRHEINEHEGNDASIDRLKFDAQYGLRDEDVYAEWRMEQADGEIHRHDDPKMHRIDAERFDDGNQQRTQQQNGGNAIQKASREQKNDIDDQQQRPHWNVQRANPLDCHRGD